MYHFQNMSVYNVTDYNEHFVTSELELFGWYLSVKYFSELSFLRADFSFMYRFTFTWEIDLKRVTLITRIQAPELEVHFLCPPSVDCWVQSVLKPDRSFKQSRQMCLDTTNKQNKTPICDVCTGEWCGQRPIPNWVAWTLSDVSDFWTILSNYFSSCCE